MYTFAHPIEDALEDITHSLCTLEFEDQRPFYDWLLQRLAEAGCLAAPLPQQYEFSRLNLSYTVLSKRKLMQLVEEGHVDGWDDPRLPTLAGARRRGFTPEAIRAFVQRMGISSVARTRASEVFPYSQVHPLRSLTTNDDGPLPAEPTAVMRESS